MVHHPNPFTAKRPRRPLPWPPRRIRQLQEPFLWRQDWPKSGPIFLQQMPSSLKILKTQQLQSQQFKIETIRKVQINRMRRCMICSNVLICTMMLQVSLILFSKIILIFYTLLKTTIFDRDLALLSRSYKFKSSSSGGDFLKYL